MSRPPAAFRGAKKLQTSKVVSQQMGDGVRLGLITSQGKDNGHDPFSHHRPIHIAQQLWLACGKGCERLPSTVPLNESSTPKRQ